MKGLEAGADDFLTKPVDDVQLMARVKSLARLKNLTDELHSRALTGQSIAIEDIVGMTQRIDATGGKLLVIENDTRSAERLQDVLSREHDVMILTRLKTRQWSWRNTNLSS